MGVEKDFLMRQLLLLFEVIQKIIRRRKEGEKGQAEDEINYFYKILNIDTDIRTMNIEQLINLLEKQKKLTNEHIEMVAFVIKEQGELENDAFQKIDFFRKSYFLLEKVDRESVTFSMDRQMKLAELKEYLKN
ncbi:MAG: hypothetical protein JXR61_09055 [Prolixibacteraceae bacterium]|nr:hypothetical protein [Prolixibacteraceae bacterium]